MFRIMVNRLLFTLNFSKSKEKVDQPESPKKVEASVEAEKSKEVKHEEEGEVAEEAGASSGGWGGWTSGWIDTGSASALLGKALSSVNAAVEVAKTKVNI